MLLLFKPDPQLQQFIDTIMLVHYQLDQTKPKPTNPLPPQPEHCLYFYPYDKVIRSHPVNQSVVELPRSIVVGPKLSRVDLTMGYNTLVIIVRFHPGGLHRFLRVPMGEMLDLSIDASLLFGSEIENIIQQINEAADYKQMIQVLECFLLKKTKTIKSSLPVDEVLIRLLQHKKPGTIVLPFRSINFVFDVVNFFMMASLPVARILLPLMAIAVTNGSDSSAVNIFPLYKIISACWEKLLFGKPVKISHNDNSKNVLVFINPIIYL